MSDSGRTAAKICAFWGVDPGSWLEDDILAMNLRAALMLATVDEETQVDEAETEADVARKHIEGMAQAHRWSEELRAVYG